MSKINLTRPVTVKLEDGRSIALVAGEQEVEDVVANHWYVKANTAPDEPVETQPAGESNSAPPAIRAGTLPLGAPPPSARPNDSGSIILPASAPIVTETSNTPVTSATPAASATLESKKK